MANVALDISGFIIKTGDILNVHLTYKHLIYYCTACTMNTSTVLTLSLSLSVWYHLLKQCDNKKNTTVTLMLFSTVRQYGWFWYCWISPVISATLRRLLKFIISGGLFGRKSGFPSSVCSMLVKYMPEDTSQLPRITQTIVTMLRHKYSTDTWLQTRTTFQNIYIWVQ